jgi:hypothetical protein
LHIIGRKKRRPMSIAIRLTVTHDLTGSIEGKRLAITSTDQSS